MNISLTDVHNIQHGLGIHEIQMTKGRPKTFSFKLLECPICKIALGLTGHPRCATAFCVFLNWNRSHWGKGSIQMASSPSEPVNCGSLNSIQVKTYACTLDIPTSLRKCELFSYECAFLFKGLSDSGIQNIYLSEFAMCFFNCCSHLKSCMASGAFKRFSPFHAPLVCGIFKFAMQLNL